ncbi:MAG: NAD-dependent epimerase/dehydratase family protein [Mangrovicoccus sp.]
MTTVIIGGTGFLGRHLCEAFARAGQTATVIAHNPDYVFLENLIQPMPAAELGTQEADEALATADTVIHLAYSSKPASNQNAEGMEIPQNVQPFLVMMGQLASAGKNPRVIYASTGGQIYGGGHDAPIPETAAPSPATPYALGKLMIEEALAYFGRKGAIQPTVLRLANPVGRWQLGRRHGFVSAAVERVLGGKPLTLFGPGQNQRDYFDADEFSDFLISLLARSGSIEGVFNIGSGLSLTERQVLSVVEETLGRAPIIDEKPARAFDLPYAVLDCGAAAEQLGWASKTSLAETVAKVASGVDPSWKG